MCILPNLHPKESKCKHLQKKGWKVENITHFSLLSSLCKRMWNFILWKKRKKKVHKVKTISPKKTLKLKILIICKKKEKKNPPVKVPQQSLLWLYILLDNQGPHMNEWFLNFHGTAFG